MEFIINDKTISAIEKKGSVFTIKLNSIYSLGGVSYNLWSEAGSKTYDDNSYTKYQHQGITIYIDKRLKVSDTVEIKLGLNLAFFGPDFHISGVLTCPQKNVQDLFRDIKEMQRDQIK